MTTGAPTIEVMALMGNTFAEVGNWAMVSHINIKMAPYASTAGTKTLWSVVLKIYLVKWGTAKPIKAIGPAKAVMPPANNPVAIMIL